MITDNMRQVVDAIVKAVDPLKVILFGSHARDEETETSDYDFYVLVPDDVDDLDMVSAKAYYSIMRMDRPPVDIVVNRVSSFNERKKSCSLERNIAIDGVVLYARK